MGIINTLSRVPKITSNPACFILSWPKVIKLSYYYATFYYTLLKYRFKIRIWNWSSYLFLKFILHKKILNFKFKTLQKKNFSSSSS